MSFKNHVTKRKKYCLIKYTGKILTGSAAEFVIRNKQIPYSFPYQIQFALQERGIMNSFTN